MIFGRSIVAFASERRLSLPSASGSTLSETVSIHMAWCLTDFLQNGDCNDETSHKGDELSLNMNCILSHGFIVQILLKFMFQLVELTFQPTFESLNI